jgi:thymidylate kinase
MRSGKFITIDGVEGAGKSTRGNALSLINQPQITHLKTMNKLYKIKKTEKGFASVKKIYA